VDAVAITGEGIRASLISCGIVLRLEEDDGVLRCDNGPDSTGTRVKFSVLCAPGVVIGA
jgi:hypothetical protein